MKKIFASVLALSVCLAANAQDLETAAKEAALALSDAPKAEEEAVKPNYWNTSSIFDLGITQTKLVDWAAGGDNQFNIKAAIDAQANYSKNLTAWTNRLQLDYGLMYTNPSNKLLRQKSVDRIYFESKFTCKTGSDSKFNYSALFDFKTQFGENFKDYAPTDDKWVGTLTSDFLAPAYTNIALGIDWAPANWISVNFAPLTGGFTICNVDELKENYGMPLLDNGDYKSALFQFGAQLKTIMKFVINDNIKYETQIVVFTDYLNEPYVRYNWDNSIDWQIAKYIKFSFKTWMIYDPIVLINDKQKIQFKDVLTFNFTYSIHNKNK